MAKAKQILSSPLKSQFGKPLGFKTPKPPIPKFNPGTFKTQHKG